MIYNFAVDRIKKSALVLIVSQTFKPYKMTSLIRGCFVPIHRVWTRAFNLICKSKHQIKNVVSKAQTKLLQDIWATCGTSRPRQPLFFSVLTAKPKVGTGICVISCVENICKGN
jgi:hypothetical protein